MTKLKLLFFTLLSVISLNLFSQTQVYTTATSGPNVCDGTASLDSSAITATNILWQGMGAVINQGSYFVNFLCPGTYSVSFVTNNTPVTLTFTITAGCSGFGITTTSTNSSTATSCNGTITVNVNGGTAPYTYIWGNGTPITSNMSTNLCPGNYVIEVIDLNLCSDFTNVDILDSSQTSVGDTLVINSVGTCNSPINIFTTTVEDCTINYATVDTAYMTINGLINSGLDSILCVWYVIDTTGTYQTYMVNYPMIDSTGCYNFQLVVYCYNKSMNYKTIVVNQNENVGFAGIDELSGNSKQLVRVLDLMGNKTFIQSNKMLIYEYSDGSREVTYILD
jgi:hypothetical protein